MYTNVIYIHRLLLYVDSISIEILITCTGCLLKRNQNFALGRKIRKNIFINTLIQNKLCLQQNNIQKK